MRKVTLIWVIGFAVSCWAQNKPPAVTVKRTPPQTQRDETSLQKKIESDLDALRQDPLAITGGPNPRPTQGPPTEGVPSDFKPNADLALTPSAEAAVKVSENWLTETVTPAAGPDGRVLYSYG